MRGSLSVLSLSCRYVCYIHRQSLHALPFCFCFLVCVYMYPSLFFLYSFTNAVNVLRLPRIVLSSSSCLFRDATAFAAIVFCPLVAPRRMCITCAHVTSCRRATGDRRNRSAFSSLLPGPFTFADVCLSLRLWFQAHACCSKCTGSKCQVFFSV